MKTKYLFTFVAVTFATVLLRAEEKSVDLSAATVVPEQPANSVLSRSAGDAVLRGAPLREQSVLEDRGPLIEAFRGGKSTQVPGRFVSLFAPQPMPSPPGTGKYFKWGDEPQPWITTVNNAASPGGRAFVDPARHEPTSRLLSLRW
ncbi:MAG: hypothetical protein HY301_06090 [Verrucomicrobia bacterium]|nr:hypothetical protein [Verrucomicrobiota bacterium]